MQSLQCYTWLLSCSLVLSSRVVMAPVHRFGCRQWPRPLQWTFYGDCHNHCVKYIDDTSFLDKVAVSYLIWFDMVTLSLAGRMLRFSYLQIRCLRMDVGLSRTRQDGSKPVTDTAGWTRTCHGHGMMDVNPSRTRQDGRKPVTDTAGRYVCQISCSEFVLRTLISMYTFYFALALYMWLNFRKSSVYSEVCTVQKLGAYLLSKTNYINFLATARMHSRMQHHWDSC